MTRQRTDGRYEARRQMRTFAGPRRFSGYGGTPAEAEADLEAKLIRAGLLQHSASLNEFAQTAYLPTVVHAGVRWREQIHWALSHILPELGALPLESVTRVRLQAFLSGKLSALSRASVGHLRKVLYAILAPAYTSGRLADSPGASS